MTGYPRFGSARRIRRAAIVGAFLLLAPGVPSAVGSAHGISPALRVYGARSLVHATEQVPLRTLHRHTPGLGRIDPALWPIARGRATRAHGSVASGLPLHAGRVRVILETRHPAAAGALVRALRGREEASSRGLVQASIPPRALGSLAHARDIDYVRLPATRIEYSVSGEEVASSLASRWQSKGITGKGVKVAIVDGGFQGLAERQADGELPQNVVTKDFCEGGFSTETGHGTAVAEIVHEMAPDAQLYLLCVGTEVDVAVAEAFAKEQGVRVINHSVGWQGPWRDDGSGPVSAVVADARANGILWVNAAGNEAETHWSGTFNGNGDSIHDFAPGDEGNSFIWESGERVCGFLKWDEWPAAVSDFDLGLFLSGANVLLAASADEQTGSQPPFEGLCVTQTSGADLQVFWVIRGYRVTSQPRLDLFTWSGPLQYASPEGSVSEPAASPAAYSVGALCWQTRQLEPYSSQGPTVDGRTKPDIAGHDSVSGETYGAFASCPSGFAGTSAAAPEVAGAAALVKQAYPAWGPTEIAAYLTKHADDLGPSGSDNLTGAGELQLPDPPDTAPPAAKALVSSGRGGSRIELRSRVSDDSGQVAVVEQVKKNGRVVATVRRMGFLTASGSTTVAVAWKAPAHASGSYQHCVRASDKAGNASPESCARLVVRSSR